MGEGLEGICKILKSLQYGQVKPSVEATTEVVKALIPL